MNDGLVAKPSFWKNTALISGVLLLGITLRLLCAVRGHNYDVDSYRIVADILNHEGNVYAETYRYNYGPIWFEILHWLDGLPWFVSDALISLRWKIAVFLVLVDFFIFLFIANKFSIKSGILFFLSPISIIITGYHSQFDNLAILIGLLSVAWFEKSNAGPGAWGALLLLGISLCVKHVLFLFPLWLAVKAHGFDRVRVLLIPYVVFILSFFPFLHDGWRGILNNVFLYRSFNNGPLWQMVLPNSVFSVIPLIVPFVASMVIMGFLVKRRGSSLSLYFYLISVVVFSSAITNQYLAICVPAIAVLWNWGYLIYSLVGLVYLLVSSDALHIESIARAISWGGTGGYVVLIAALATGLVLTYVGRANAGSDTTRARSARTGPGA